MLNCLSIFRQTISGFEYLIEKYPKIENKIRIDKLRSVLIYEIDVIVKNILINLKNKYPEASAEAYNLKFKELIS